MGDARGAARRGQGVRTGGDDGAVSRDQGGGKERAGGIDPDVAIGADRRDAMAGIARHRQVDVAVQSKRRCTRILQHRHLGVVLAGSVEVFVRTAATCGKRVTIAAVLKGIFKDQLRRGALIRIAVNLEHRAGRVNRSGEIADIQSAVVRTGDEIDGIGASTDAGAVHFSQ